MRQYKTVNIYGNADPRGRGEKNILKNNVNKLPKFDINYKLSDPRSSQASGRINRKKTKTYQETSQPNCWKSVIK